MDNIALPSNTTLVGKVYAAQNRLVVDHEHGRLMVEVNYGRDRDVLLVRAEFLTNDMELENSNCAFPISDLPVLIKHFARILRGCVPDTKVPT